MSFVFYPKLEQSCPNVSHCPHLGGAAIGILVDRANDNELYLRQLHGTIDEQRKRNSEIFEENQRLQKELEQVKLELKLERQNKFATNEQKSAESSATPKATSESTTASAPKKRGAPVGHPGWSRETPTEYDWAKDVPPPNGCRYCKGHVTVDDGFAPFEHLQEDVIDGQYRVVLYLHPAACCDDCGEWLQQPGKGELLGSRLGPNIRSKAMFLRNVIGMSTPGTLLFSEKAVSPRSGRQLLGFLESVPVAPGAIPKGGDTHVLGVANEIGIVRWLIDNGLVGG